MYINPALGGKLTVVARGQVSSPALSADGEVVVYNELKDGETAVYRHEDGETVKLSDGNPSMHADLSADGSEVVYTRYSQQSLDDRGSWDIVRWDEESQKNEVISASFGDESRPQISDDGKVIAWEDDVDRKLGGNNVMKWVDGKVEVVSFGPRMDLTPNLSGNGERIVWKRFDSGVSSLWAQDHNGTVKPYLQSKDDLSGPSQSYDGQKIVYSDKSAGEEDLFLYDDATGERTMIAGERKVKEKWGSISGDGQSIAWANLDFRNGSPAETNVFLQQADSSIQVTQTEGGMNTDPKLSHDGKTLIWTWIDNDDTDNRAIYKLDLDG